MALSKDESTSSGRGRIVDPKRDQGLVLYRSNFDAGYDGWVTHWTGNPARPYPPPSLSSRVPLRGSRCLCISTGEDAYSASRWDNTGYAVKRMSIWQPKRFHSLSGYVAVGEGANGAWQSFVLIMDLQSFDNTIRSTPQLICSTRPSPDFSRFSVLDNAGASVTVPASTHLAVGNNENKNNYNYVRLTFDTQANSGLGGYHEMQINQQTISLVGLGQSATVTPQTASQYSGQEIGEFNGGGNIMFGVTRNTVTGGCQLFVDDIVYAVSDTWI